MNVILLVIFCTNWVAVLSKRLVTVKPMTEIQLSDENDISFPNDHKTLKTPKNMQNNFQIDQFQLTAMERKLIAYYEKRKREHELVKQPNEYGQIKEYTARPPMPGEPFPLLPNVYKPNKVRSTRRLCEIIYSEYVRRIFAGDADTVADADDSEFDGRTLAQPGEYPHMAAIGFEMHREEDIDYKCGGSLISDKFVLTAAHCTLINGKAPTKVRIGDLDLMVEERYIEPQTRSIRQIYQHPNYKNELYYHDIALIELDREIVFTEYVRPIRLWIHSEVPTTIAFAMGYGATSFAKAATKRLTNLNLTIVSNDECNKELPVLNETPNGVIASQICAHDYILNRDTCQGDSGGPLQLNLPGRRRHRRIHYHLIGVTSYGLFCRSAYPSVYTRVSAYLDWIEHVVWSARLRI